jgi:uncharacterized damage-inducible protein DinB
MTLREYYLQRLEAETPVFLKVFKALPKDQLDYKPDERSPSASELIWTITSALKSCQEVIKDNRAEHHSNPPPPIDQMLEMFEERSRAISDGVSSMDEARWKRTAEFFYKGKRVAEQPVGEFLWFVLFDAIHHRGQLAAYLRPMGGKVPAIYGPSADEKSMMAAEA